jgi:Ni,Fe-hydrogenase I cytochrome b subunit
MSPYIYSIIHIFSLLVLTGYAFYAFGAPAEAKKKVMMITGIASLLMLVSGFGLISKVYQNQFAAWMVVKLVCWLGLSALAGIGFRKRDKPCVFIAIILVLVLVAIITVYTHGRNAI